MSVMRRFGIWIGVLAVIVIAGAAGWLYLRAPAKEEMPQTVAVTRGSVEETVLASGTIEARSLVSVGAEVSGTIKKLDVALGDAVKAGDVIAEIDSTNQQNAVRASEAALANIAAQQKIQDANLASAEATLARAEKLGKQSLVSDADLQAAQLAVTTAKAQQDALAAQIEQAEINVDTAKLNLSRTTILAPVDGTVVAVLVDAGQTVNANNATPTIVKLADLDNMVVRAEVSEADVPRVEPGQKVYFSILGEPDRQIEATLRSIDPAPASIASDTASTSSSSSAVYYDALFDVPNPDHKLRIAMTAQVTIVLDSAEDVLTVPASVLGRAGRDGAYHLLVWDAAAGTETPREVRIGLNNNVTAAVVSGLEEGDRVVATGRTVPAGAAEQGGNRGGGAFRGGGGLFGGRGG
jgi:macrolide-specific efflux system membrane fusion protein